MLLFIILKDVVVRQLISQVRSMEEHISQLQSELAIVTNSPITSAESNDQENVAQYEVRYVLMFEIEIMYHMLRPQLVVCANAKCLVSINVDAQLVLSSLVYELSIVDWLNLILI